MKVAVIFDGVATDDDGTVAPDVAGVMEAADAVIAALATLGHAPAPVPLRAPVDDLASRLDGAELAFNLAEGLEGRAEEEAAVAAAVERLGVPLTGASAATLALCRRKDRVNALLEARGVSVPAWVLSAPGATAAAATAQGWSAFPAIVKPAGEDGSVGIGDDSVVEDAFELQAALARVTGDALVQRFVPGRELNVGFVGGVALPVSEIAFSGWQRVVSYAAKWDAGSAADLATRPLCPAPLPGELVDEVLELAAAAWKAVGGTGYGRVDLRTDELGRPWVLEVNPNPDLAPGAGLARMAAAARWSYAELVRRIVAEAAP